MSTFIFRLVGMRPTFAIDMTSDEREIMGLHMVHWQPYIESGQMVFFGPVVDSLGSWGLGVLEADSEEEVARFVAADPVVTSGTGRIEIGMTPGGFVRAGSSSGAPLNATHPTH